MKTSKNENFDQKAFVSILLLISSSQCFGKAVHWWGVLTDLKLIWNKLLTNFLTKLPRVSYTFFIFSIRNLLIWSPFKLKSIRRWNYQRKTLQPWETLIMALFKLGNNWKVKVGLREWMPIKTCLWLPLSMFLQLSLLCRTILCRMCQN